MAAIDDARNRYYVTGSDADLKSLVAEIMHKVTGKHIEPPAAPPELTADERRLLLEQAARIGAVVVGVGAARLTSTLTQIDAARTIALAIIAVDAASIGVGVSIIASALAAQAPQELTVHFVIVNAVAFVPLVLSAALCGWTVRRGSSTREYAGLEIRALYDASVGRPETDAFSDMASALDRAISVNFDYLATVRRAAGRGLLLFGFALTCVIVLAAVLFH